MVMNPVEVTEAVEHLADLQHEIWSHWMVYLFGCCHPLQQADGGYTMIIPAPLVARWERQIKTPYARLSEKEKDSDREQARKVLEVVTRTRIC